MRHRKAGRKLGRNTNQRKMLLRNLAVSLIEHGSIVTTKAKAKELRRYIERIITKVKHEDQSHAQRLVFKKLQNKEAVKRLFKEYKDAFVDRPGGYTRIFLLGNRPGDAAEMAKISLILDTGIVETEEEETEVKEEKPKKKTSAKAKAKTKAKEEAKAEEVKEEEKEEKSEEKSEE